MQVGHDFGCGGILYRHILGFLVLVDGQVIVVVGDLLPGDKETLFGPLTVGFLVQVMEPGDDVGDIVVGDFGALVIQRKAVGFHIIEPDIFGAACAGLGEYQHCRGHACIGLEHTGRHEGMEITARSW